jgi:hypothetical protein
MSWVKIYSTHYSEGCVIITGLNYGQPIFGKIMKVILVFGDIIFQYRKLEVLEYSESVNAYEVTLLVMFSLLSKMIYRIFILWKSIRDLVEMQRNCSLFCTVEWIVYSNLISDRPDHFKQKY